MRFGAMDRLSFLALLAYLHALITFLPACLDRLPFFLFACLLAGWLACLRTCLRASLFACLVLLACLALPAPACLPTTLHACLALAALLPLPCTPQCVADGTPPSLLQLGFPLASCSWN